VAVVALEVGIGILLISRFGLVGAAVARAAGTAVNNLLPMAQVWRHLKIHPYRRDFWKPVAAGGTATAAAVAAVRFTGVGNGIVAGVVGLGVLGVVYLAIFVGLGLSVEDRTALATLRSSARRAARPSTRRSVPGPGESDVSLSPLVDEPGG